MGVNEDRSAAGILQARQRFRSRRYAVTTLLTRGLTRTRHVCSVRRRTFERRAISEWISLVAGGGLQRASRYDVYV